MRTIVALVGTGVEHVHKLLAQLQEQLLGAATTLVQIIIAVIGGTLGSRK